MQTMFGPSRPHNFSLTETAHFVGMQKKIKHCGKICMCSPESFKQSPLREYWLALFFFSFEMSISNTFSDYLDEYLKNELEYR